ncbi:hypothetical protein FRC17_004940, partial [Serendipita sp. 399]
WQLIDLALSAYSKVGVALYSTLGLHAIEYIINHAELSLLFVSSRNINSLVDLAPKCPKLRIVVSIDKLAANEHERIKAELKEWKIELVNLHELEAAGAANPLPPVPPKPDTILTICYSSGTTSSTPKGVVLTHWNVVSSALSLSQGFVFNTDNTNTNVAILSYLPLAHIFGRVLELTAFLLGCRIGYYTGDPLRLIEDAQILKPTVFPAVPRILNRIAGKVREVIEAGGLKGTLLRWALDSKTSRIQLDGYPHHWLWDRLIFGKLKAVLGGRVQYIVSGAAPLVPEVLYTIRAAFGCEVYEGWGLTETCGAGARSLPGDPSSAGTVGTPNNCVEVKLVDVPELGYSVDGARGENEDGVGKTGPRGELCVRGESVFKEYYKDMVMTAECKDDDGWFHTGDIGEVDSRGRIKIIDRMKGDANSDRTKQNVMKLSQGEFVALEKVESAYSTCPLIAQVFIYGQNTQNRLVALVVPEPPVLVKIIEKVQEQERSRQQQKTKENPPRKSVDRKSVDFSRKSRDFARRSMDVGAAGRKSGEVLGAAAAAAAAGEREPAVIKLVDRKVDVNDTEGLQAFCEERAVKEEIKRLLEIEANRAGLVGFEKISDFKVVLEPFSTDNNMMTPTFKLRRREIESRYRDVLQALYKEEK